MTPRTRRQAYARYQSDQVTTASPLKLVVLLYRRAIAALAAAERDLGNRAELARAQAIVGELEASLNHEPAPELSQNLAELYSFVHERIGQALAGSQDAVEGLAEARQVMTTLAAGWEGALAEDPAVSAA